jgi:phenylpropionate dioxygenase-like ring-hydroxylating dioxygenase large terminal subunit
MFLHSAWYVAAYSSELDEKKIISLSMLGEPVVLYRKTDGTVVALEDRCVHRFAPLSLGRLEGDNIRCMYHGLLFNACGKTIEIPGQDMIPPQACVRSYPVVERSGWLWVWMGDKDKADESLIAPVYGMRHPDWFLPEDQMDYECNYELINNNLTDLGHLAWVHAQSFGADESWTNSTPKVSAIEHGVRMDRWIRNIPPIPPLGKAASHERVDHWTQLDYLVPGVFHFYNALYPAGHAEKLGGEPPAKDDPALLYEHYTQQAVTPMTEKTTRYFYTWGPSNRVGNEEESAIMRQVLDQAFQEDKVIIHRQQAVIDMDPDRRPMPTVHDKGVTIFQNHMRKLMREERKGVREAATS